MLRKLLLLCLFIFILAGCNTVTVTHIEAHAFQTTQQNSEGFWEAVGYHNTNSVIHTIESKNHRDISQKKIQDFYDLEGNYIETLATNYSYRESSVSGLEREHHEEYQLDIPSTILVPEIFDINDKTSSVLDENEKLQVKEHITELFNELSKNK